MEGYGCQECGECVHALLDTTDELSQLIEPTINEFQVCQQYKYSITMNVHDCLSCSFTLASHKGHHFTSEVIINQLIHNAKLLELQLFFFFYGGDSGNIFILLTSTLRNKVLYKIVYDLKA